MDYARMWSADLSEADVSSARLQGVDMTGVQNLDNTDFTYSTGCSTVIPKGILNGKGCNN